MNSALGVNLAVRGAAANGPFEAFAIGASACAGAAWHNHDAQLQPAIQDTQMMFSISI
jgi:hypothetical protein